MNRALFAAVVILAACSPVPSPPDGTVATARSSPPPVSAVPVPSPTSIDPTPELTTPEPTTPPWFDAPRALALATELAGMGPRDAGTPGDARARAWLRDRLEQAGWTVSEESFALPQGGSTANVIAVREPAHLDGPHIVFGGHVDTRNRSPGANDNASGIGVLVAAAEALATDPAVPVVVVGFGAEEFQPAQRRVHHLGSQDYATRRGDNVIAALIVDMVGNGPSTCICWFDAGPRTLADRLAAVADMAGLDGYEVAARGDISDHGPFARQGRPAAFLWTYEDGRYHTAADTAEHLQVEDLQRAGDLLLAFMRSLTVADVTGLQSGV